MRRPSFAAAAATLALAAPPASAYHQHLVVTYGHPSTSLVDLRLWATSARADGDWRTAYGCSLVNKAPSTERVTSGRCQLWAYSPANGYFTTQGGGVGLTGTGDVWTAAGEIWSFAVAEDFMVCLRWTARTPAGEVRTHEACTAPDQNLHLV